MAHLTPAIVNALKPPVKGEQWLADGALRGFGVRLWATARGGRAAYAIRVRDANGIVRRETYSIWSDWRARNIALHLIAQGSADIPLGPFLEEARVWARKRIRLLKGGTALQEIRATRRDRVAQGFLGLTLKQYAERTWRKMAMAKRKDTYTDQLLKLFERLPPRLKCQPLMKLNIHELAVAITDPGLGPMQSRALQAFVGQLYVHLAHRYGPVFLRHEALTRCISTLRSRRPLRPLFPADQLARLFDQLSTDRSRWRSALALKLYFETGAKLRRVLAMRWDQIVEGNWYPYAPHEREYWFMGAERLTPEAMQTLEAARTCLAAEGCQSAYVFPSPIPGDDDRPITTVARYWRRLTRNMDRGLLSLRHAAAQVRARNTPSYFHSYVDFFVPLQRQLLNPDLVSKIGNQAKKSDEKSPD